MNPLIRSTRSVRDARRQLHPFDLRLSGITPTSRVRKRLRLSAQRRGFACGGLYGATHAGVHKVQFPGRRLNKRSQPNGVGAALQASTPTAWQPPLPLR